MVPTKVFAKYLRSRRCGANVRELLREMHGCGYLVAPSSCQCLDLRATYGCQPALLDQGAPDHADRYSVVKFGLGPTCYAFWRIWRFLASVSVHKCGSAFEPLSCIGDDAKQLRISDLNTSLVAVFSLCPQGGVSLIPGNLPRGCHLSFAGQVRRSDARQAHGGRADGVDPLPCHASIITHSGNCIHLRPSLASRRAGPARPGRARLVQVERPTGRTTWTRRAWSGCLWCAAGQRRGWASRSCAGPGRVALAAGGRSPVVGPEALPAGGTGCVPVSWRDSDPGGHASGLPAVGPGLPKHARATYLGHVRCFPDSQPDQASAALYRVVLSRLRWDPRTRDYMQRRTKDSLTEKEIIRCLKRFVAREFYQLITAKNLEPAT